MACPFVNLDLFEEAVPAETEPVSRVTLLFKAQPVRCVRPLTFPASTCNGGEKPRLFVMIAGVDPTTK